jgi:hypothetical protein
MPSCSYEIGFYYAHIPNKIYLYQRIKENFLKYYIASMSDPVCNKSLINYQKI